MPETIEQKNEAETKTDVKVEIAFPRVLAKTPASFHDDENDEVWIGIPLREFNNPILILAAMDRFKLDVLQFQDMFARKMIERAKITNGVKAVQEGKTITEKLKGFVGIGRA